MMVSVKDIKEAFYEMHEGKKIIVALDFESLKISDIPVDARFFALEEEPNEEPKPEPKPKKKATKTATEPEPSVKEEKEEPKPSPLHEAEKEAREQGMSYGEMQAKNDMEKKRKERDKRILELYAEDVSYTDIGKEVGCTAQTVINRLKQMGVRK